MTIQHSRYKTKFRRRLKNKAIQFFAWLDGTIHEARIHNFQPKDAVSKSYLRKLNAVDANLADAETETRNWYDYRDGRL